MPIHFDNTEGRWRFTFNRVIDGHGRVRATKLLPKGYTKRQAHDFDQEETARLFKEAKSPNTERRTIAAAVKIYCEEVIPKLKAGDKQLKEFVIMFDAYKGRYIDELPEVAREYRSTAKQIRKYKDGLERPLATATINNRIAYLRAACRYAFEEHKFCEHDPAERLSLPNPNNERQFYATYKEFLQICRKITNLSARAAVMIGFYSGMRLGEILRCEIVNGYFFLKDTKNGSPKMIPIHPKLRRYLHRMPIKAAYRTIEGCFKRAVKKLGLGHLRFHDVRHSTASALINSGASMKIVQSVLGHKSAQSSNRYSHLYADTLTNAVGLIGKKKAQISG